MRMRRFLALLCSLFLIFCVVWPGAYAADYPVIDELGIDPWGELQEIQQGGISTAQDLEQDKNLINSDYEVSQDVQVMMMSDDGIALLSDGSEYTYKVGFGGFSYTGTDQDGDEFDMSLKDPGYRYTLPTNAVSNDKTGFTGMDPLSWFGSQAWYLGRPSVISGDPQISVWTHSLSGSSGSLIVSPVLDSTSSVSSVYVDKLTTRLSPILCVSPNYGTNSFSWPSAAYSNLKFTFSGAYLYVDGYEKGRLLTSSTTLGYLNGQPIYEITIADQTVTFDAPIDIDNVSIHYTFTSSSQNGMRLSSNGGFRMILAAQYGGYIAPGAVFKLNVDSAAQNTGLLKSIIQFLQNIVNGISNLASSIAALPGLIGNVIMDGLKSLFIPSEEDFTELKTKYETLLSERLGFVWQAGETVISFGQSVLSAMQNTQAFQFEFPGISFELPELGTVTLIQPQTVSLDNAFMDVMQPVLGTIVSFICVLAFINTAERMVVAVVSGVSYFHFLKGD